MRHITLLSLLVTFSIEAAAQAGTLDPTFGDNGKVLVPTLGAGFDDQAVTAVVLPDGKILVAGRSSDNDHFNTVLLRFNADGSPDMTFGTDGLVLHDLAPGDEFVRSSALDAQGRLVVGGNLFSEDLINSDMFVARFLADGSLDPTFGGTGLIVRDLHTTPDAEEAHEVLIQLDGKIVLCGFTGPSLEFTEIVVERYLENGGLDPSFGGDGSVLAFISNGSAEQLRGAVLGPNGAIYFCGFVVPFMETEQAILLGHVNTEGNSPSTFGNNNGHSFVHVSGSNLIARTMAVMPDGDLILAGAQRTPGASQARFIYAFDALGEEGFSTLEDNPDGGDAWNSLLVQNDGAILAGGNEADGPESRNWHVDRFVDPDMIADPAFDAVDYDEAGGEETCFDLKFTSDSSIIGIGSVLLDEATRIVLLKYKNNISTNIAEVHSGPSISVYPNPALDRTTVTVGAAAKGPIDLVLFDAQGRAVRRWSQSVVAGTSFEVDLRHLMSGMYALQLNNAGLKTTVKLAKQ